MAYSRTLAELELAVRREADMVNSQFVTSAEVRSYINQSWAELYDRIVLFDQEYLLRYTDIPSSAASSAGDFDILNDGKTGLVRNVLAASDAPGPLVVGTTYLIVPALGGYTAPAYVRIDGVSGGAATSWTLLSAGSGYFTSPPSDPNAVQGQLYLPGGLIPVGNVTFQLDSDFYKCKGVWMSDSSSGGTFWNPLRRFQWEQQNILRQADEYFQQGLTALPLYRLFTLNGLEKIAIAPMVSGTYRVWYYPAPYKMLVDNDRIDGRSGWDEWVVKDTAIKCLLKEESIEQAAAIKAVRDELFSRFQLHASERDASQPEKIRNVNLLSRRPFPWAR
jgi:hypothetical protein